jgi:hypothetical protein
LDSFPPHSTSYRRWKTLPALDPVSRPNASKRTNGTSMAAYGGFYRLQASGHT